VRGNRFTARVQRPNPQWDVGAAPVTPQVGQRLGVMTGEHARKELQSLLGLADREHFRKAYLLPAWAADLIEPTQPDKPNSRRQKYRLTEAGQRLLQELQGTPAS